MVEFRGVSKVYDRAAGGRVEALRDVSFAVKAGELAVVLGPSGAGKSTVLDLVSGRARPTGGTVRVDDVDVAACGDRALARLRRRLGVVTPAVGLLPDRTVFGNLAFVLRALGVGGSQARTQALEALEAGGLTAVRNALPHELADGERRRLLIARALAARPRLLLADEPAASLPDEEPAIGALLRAVHGEGLTCLIATQSATLARALEGRVVRLVQGRLEPEGVPG